MCLVFVCVSLQKMISSAQQSEADLSVSALDDDLDLEKHSEEKIDRLVGNQCSSVFLVRTRVLWT